MVKVLFAKQARLAEGWARDVTICIDVGGTITAVRCGEPAPDGAQSVGLLVPGMPNVHSHAFQRVLAGWMEQAGPGADSFWSWRERMYACVARITAAEFAAITTYLYIEMLKAGYTCVGEFHYLHHTGAQAGDAPLSANSLTLIRAAEAVGIRLTILPTLYMHAGFDRQPVNARQQRFVVSVEDYIDLVDVLRRHTSAKLSVGIAFHSLRAVAPAALTGVLEYHAANHPDGPVHIHVAEQTREVADCVAWSGQRPVEWLLDHAGVDRRWCIIHATHMSPAETRALAATGAVVGLCPTTEANLGDGLFPLAEFLDAGGQIAIGSDSHVSVDPFEELRWLEYGQRLHVRQRNIAASEAQPHTGARLFTSASSGGARALGQPAGRIAAGQRADLLVIDHGSPLFSGCVDDELFDCLIFAGGANPITDVMVGGEWVIRDRRHPLEDDAAMAFGAARRRLATPANVGA